MSSYSKELPLRKVCSNYSPIRLLHLIQIVGREHLMSSPLAQEEVQDTGHKPTYSGTGVIPQRPAVITYKGQREVGKQKQQIFIVLSFLSVTQRKVYVFSLRIVPFQRFQAQHMKQPVSTLSPETGDCPQEQTLPTTTSHIKDKITKTFQRDKGEGMWTRE